MFEHVTVTINNNIKFTATYGYHHYVLEFDSPYDDVYSMKPHVISFVSNASASKLNHVYLYSRCFYYLFYFSYLIQFFHFSFQKLEATTFAPRVVIGIAIGAGSLAGGILLFCVICRLWRRSNDKDAKFEQQQDKINSVIPAIPPSTFPHRATEKLQFII